MRLEKLSFKYDFIKNGFKEQSYSFLPEIKGKDKEEAISCIKEDFSKLDDIVKKTVSSCNRPVKRKHSSRMGQDIISQGYIVSFIDLTVHLDYNIYLDKDKIDRINIDLNMYTMGIKNYMINFGLNLYNNATNLSNLIISESAQDSIKKIEFILSHKDEPQVKKDIFYLPSALLLPETKE